MSCVDSTLGDEVDTNVGTYVSTSTGTEDFRDDLDRLQTSTCYGLCDLCSAAILRIFFAKALSESSVELEYFHLAISVFAVS